MQSGSATPAPAAASEFDYDANMLHLSAHSDSQCAGMVHIDPSQKSLNTVIPDSAAHSNFACLPQPSATSYSMQIQQQAQSQRVSPFQTATAAFPLPQVQQHAPCMVKQESQGLGASDWGLADWLGDMMGPSHLDAPLQLDGDFSFECLPTFEGAWLPNRHSTQDRAPASALPEEDPCPTSCSFPSGGLYTEQPLIDGSFTVPDILDGTAFVWDTGYPQSSFLGVAPCMDGTVLSSELPTAFALRDRDATEALQRVPALPVSLPVQQSKPPSGPSGRAERRAARAARLAASDESASISSDSGRATGSEPSHGSGHRQETDGGSALSEETSVIPYRSSQRSTLAMMPEIGFPRVGRSGGRHPTDAELKAAIAVLQERTTSLPSYSQSASVHPPPFPPSSPCRRYICTHSCAFMYGHLCVMLSASV